MINHHDSAIEPSHWRQVKARGVMQLLETILAMWQTGRRRVHSDSQALRSLLESTYLVRTLVQSLRQQNRLSFGSCFTTTKLILDRNFSAVKCRILRLDVHNIEKIALLSLEGHILFYLSCTVKAPSLTNLDWLI